MTEAEIAAALRLRYSGLVQVEAWGETAFFYNPGAVFKRGAYFATIKTANGENDSASGLDRDGVFRFNFGAPVNVYEALFGPRPARPKKGEVVVNPMGAASPAWDFTRLDTLYPHPVYGWMGWICVLNPSDVTWATCLPMIDHAYEKAVATFERRLKAR